MERKLWQCINRDQLLGFRFNRQKPLLSYIVDFYCAKAKLISNDEVMREIEEVVEQIYLFLENVRAD